MSNPYGIIGLTYDGTDLQNADFTIYLTIKTGLNELPSVRGEDTIVPSLAGRIEMNRVNDIIPLVLEGQVTGDPSDDQDTQRAQFRTNMRLVRSLFTSNRERADLVATLEDGSTATISARPMNIGVPTELASVYAALSIELEGYDDWDIVAAS